MADRFSVQITYGDVTVAANVKGDISSEVMDRTFAALRAEFREAVAVSVQSTEPAPGPLASDTTVNPAPLGFTADVPDQYIDDTA